MSSPKTILSLYSQNKDILRSLLAEFCATGLLVLFTCGTCVLNSNNTLSIALSFGLTITCLIAIFGHVSGCHINPGVTIGLLANGQLATVRAVLYIVAQLLGSVLGATILAAVLPTGRKNLCATTLNPMISPVQGIIVELFIVFLLVFVICNVCESNSNLAPLTIGLAVATGHLFAIPLTSSSMNSARSFGPALIQGQWNHHYVYWIGPLLGGALGGLFHRFLFQNQSLHSTTTPTKTNETLNITTNI